MAGSSPPVVGFVRSDDWGTSAASPAEAAFAAGKPGCGDAGGSFSGTKEISPLSLTPQEVADLVEFMKALDGAELPSSVTSTPTLP